jgi:hypothetical protein
LNGVMVRSISLTVGCRHRGREPRRAWVPPGVRALVGTRIEREYSYAHAAVSALLFTCFCADRSTLAVSNAKH